MLALRYLRAATAATTAASTVAAAANAAVPTAATAYFTAAYTAATPSSWHFCHPAKSAMLAGSGLRAIQSRHCTLLTFS